MRRSPRFLFLALATAVALLASPLVEARTSRAAREEAEQERREAAAEAHLRASSRRMAEVLIQEEMARKERLARREKAAAAAASAQVARREEAAAGPAGDSGLDAVFGRNEQLTAPTGAQDRYYMPASIPPSGTGDVATATPGPPPATGPTAEVDEYSRQSGPAQEQGLLPAAGGGDVSPPAGVTGTRGTAVAPGTGGAANLELFHSGYSHYSQGDFAAARQSFASFLAAHPGHELADSAQYWLGQCAAAEGDYARALAEYRRVIESFPFGDKVPDALLKSGEALMELGREAEARRAWEELAREFPETGAGRRARQRLGEGADMAAADTL